MERLRSVRDLNDFCVYWDELRTLADFQVTKELSPDDGQTLMRCIRDMADFVCRDADGNAVSVSKPK